MIRESTRLAALALALACGWLCAAPAWAQAPTLAIADLENHTGDTSLDAAGAGVASVLISKFARVEAVQVVERARLQELIGELELVQAGVVDPATAAEAGRVLGADYMVLGSLFSVQLPSIAVSLRVVEVESGAVVTSEDVTGTVGDGGEEFFVLIDELSYRILEGLEVRLASRDRIEFGQVEVRQLETVSVFGQALRAIDRDEADAAQDLLARAMALEPGFTLAEETLAQLSAEVAGRRTAYAHRAIEEVHGCWDQRERQRRCQKVHARLATEAITPELRGQEEGCLDAFKEQPGGTLAGYQAFQRRADGGYYDDLLDQRDYRDLASGWQKRADSLLGDAWYVERRLQHLLTYQRLVAPRDEEEAERYRERVEKFIEGAYRR